ncbi:hypothetical protein [Candidatus Borrarchaeum sp.]|uniref:hypothetical protein n=1 Tax=Candidatus Borrarchaeum sp. TaxID=2846742 RepID=UPI00257E094F|nr:hypothetical protein [Candidatus Borrarchaeum sp.]
MDFKSEMQFFFNLRDLTARKGKIHNILSQLEKMQQRNDPVISLNMAEALIENCLLIDNDEDRLQHYNRALELVQIARLILKEKSQTRLLLRSYHLECFIKYHTMKYRDEEASILDIFNLGGKIIKRVTQAKTNDPYTEYDDYCSLGCVWRAYGLMSQLIHKFQKLNVEQRRDMLENARALTHKAVDASNSTNNRDANVLSAYIFAFVETSQMVLRGDKATTEKDFIKIIGLYDVLFEAAHSYGSIEFEYLALLNHTRLNLSRYAYTIGTNEEKRELLHDILNDCKKLEEYNNLIRMPHFLFYYYTVRTEAYLSFLYFEVFSEKEYNYYVNKALKSAEKLKFVYESKDMISERDKIDLHHNLIFVYMMTASFATSQKEKHEYLKKCEELLLEDEQSTAVWSQRAYSIWRDLSSIYLDLAKVERNHIYFEKCVFYAKKAYYSALETEVFTDAFFEAYKIAMIAESFQKHNLSIKHYNLALQLLAKIIQAGKDYPYYRNLETYLSARLLGVKAKEEHRKGSYIQATNLYREASSILRPNKLYLYESLLYNIYALFEDASTRFIEEKYKETFTILSNITCLFDETAKHYAEDYKPQFQYFIDRRAYDLQLDYFESSKTFCLAQSNILQALIYRSTGDSERSIKLLKEANTLLKPFTDRNIHIAGYSSFAKGLYGLEKSELNIRNGEYKRAASYLANASDQFETASKVLASDEQLRQLCDGLKFFCRGWMNTLEIMRRDIDHSTTELHTNFTLASQSFVNATRSLKMFKKTSKGVSGFEKLLSYIYYSLLFQKTDDLAEKSKFKDNMTAVLGEALQYFKDAEDMERYRFTKDIITTLLQLEDIRENILKPITIPFTLYTPIFDSTTIVEPSSVNIAISLDKDQVEVNDEIQYTIEINSDNSVYMKQIDGLIPKKGVKVVSNSQLAKNGTIEINRFLSPGNPIKIEFQVQASTPLHNKAHPRLLYLNTKNEKCRAFTLPLTLQVYPKNALKSGVVCTINEKINLVKGILKELGIILGEFPVLYHDINSYREALAEYYFRYKTDEGGKKHRSKKTDISKIPIQQMAFVDPLGEVNILYDLETYLYPQSIANLLGIIIHEKFGHGFFQQYTSLGKKLLELEYHQKGVELLMKELEKISNKYAMGIQWLAVSTLIVDEGFATWLELKTFEKLLEKISDKDSQFIQQIHHEIESFRKTVFESEELNVKHEYFALKYEKTVINPYAEGYDLFSQIEEKYGEKCVPKALEIAANVPLTKRQISLMPNTIKNDKTCADKRLEKIACSDLKIERNNVDMFEKAAKELFL